MITLNEIAYNIKNLAYGGSHSTEESISLRQIKSWIHYHRAKIISDNLNRGMLTNHNLFQVYDLSAYTLFDKVVAQYIDDFTADFRTADPTDASLYSDNGVRYLSLIPKQGSAANYPNQIKGDVPAFSAITYDSSGNAQNTLAAFNRTTYGQPQRDRLIQGDWRNNGRLVFTVPQPLPVDNYLRSVRSVSLSRRAVLASNPNRQAASTSIINVPIRTGQGNLYNQQPLAKFSTTSGTNQLDRDMVTVSITNLQVSPNYMNNTDALDNKSVVWVYKGALRAIFSDPTKVVAKRTKIGTATQYRDDIDPYPLPMEYVKDLIERILALEVRTELSMPSDLINDAQDSTKLQGGGA
jgi:hypothetical protein